jgi:ribonuclease P protein component
VLPAKNRLRTSKDFALTTKTGVRATSTSLVLYLTNTQNPTGESAAPKIGLIVNKAVGGSVTRHRVSRQLRHLISPYLNQLPSNSLLVIRVLRPQADFSEDLAKLLSKLTEKKLVSA